MNINKILFLLVLIITTISCSTTKPRVQAKRTAQITKKEVYSRPLDVKASDQTVSSGVIPESETLEATSRVKVTTDMVVAYINQFKEIAKKSMINLGVPASITLAQGILESGAGTGALSVQANNHFGIKCHKEWNGSSVKYDDDAKDECFRKYKHAEESYRDHSIFLTSRPWYASLFLLPKEDYKSWARGLKKAGYATDVKYPEKLIGIIEKFQLQQYDAEVLGITYIFKEKNESKPTADDVIVVDATVDTEYYTVLKGDTLYSISKKFNINIEELKQKNNLSEKGLSLGQSIKVK
jgi:flagellum-specific peptidoglycan hydrolase FlgJ